MERTWRISAWMGLEKWRLSDARALLVRSSRGGLPSRPPALPGDAGALAEVPALPVLIRPVAPPRELVPSDPPRDPALPELEARMILQAETRAGRASARHACAEEAKMNTTDAYISLAGSIATAARVTAAAAYATYHAYVTACAAAENPALWQDLWLKPSDQLTCDEELACAACEAADISECVVEDAVGAARRAGEAARHWSDVLHEVASRSDVQAFVTPLARASSELSAAADLADAAVQAVMRRST